MARVESVDLIRWQAFRLLPEYQKFFKRLIDRGIVEKRGKFFVLNKNHREAQDVVKECNAKWGLIKPIDFINQNPKPPLFIQTPVKLRSKKDGIAVVEIDLSFKKTQILTRLNDLIDDDVKKFHHDPNPNLEITKRRSRAYELSQVRPPLTKERMIEIMKAEGLSYPPTKHRDKHHKGKLLERDEERTFERDIEAFKKLMASKKLLGLKHWLDAVPQKTSSSNSENQDGKSTFMRDLKKL